MTRFDSLSTLVLATLALNSLPLSSVAAHHLSPRSMPDPPMSHMSPGKLPANQSSSLHSFRPALPKINDSHPVIPTDLDLSAVLVGYGLYNYTCSHEDWELDGIDAALFDLSANTTLLEKVSDSEHENSSGPQDPSKLLSPFLFDQEFPLAAVYTTESSSSGTGSAKLKSIFSFISEDVKGRPDISKGDTYSSKCDNSTTVVRAEAASNIPSPQNPLVDVDWLRMNGLDDSFAKVILRTHSHGGQRPLGKCSHEGAKIRVFFSAIFWFYGSKK